MRFALRLRGFCIVAVGAWLCDGSSALAHDWPTLGHNPARTWATPEELPPALVLNWTRHLGPVRLAWPDQPKLTLDAAYEPVVSGGRIVVASANDDSLAAYDVQSGAELWRFFTDGPIRTPPVIDGPRVLAASDDGYLYALDLADGRLLWKVRGGPRDRLILGNERLVSSWPARGGPVVVDGTVYFAASIWPFMGVFIHAVDAATGQSRWINSGEGSRLTVQPHNSDSFAGVAPQGALAAAGDCLLVPNGRAVSACFERQTGRLRYFHHGENGKRGGGSDVTVAGRFFLNGGQIYELETGAWLASLGMPWVVDGGVLYYYKRIGSKLIACDLAGAEIEETKRADRQGKEIVTRRLNLDELWSLESPLLEALIKAGSRLYAAADGQVLVFEPAAQPNAADAAQNAAPQDSQSQPQPAADRAIAALEADAAQAADPLAPPRPAAAPPALVAALKIEGAPVRLLAAAGRLWVVTREGAIHSYAAQPGPVVHPAPAPPEQVEIDPAARALVELWLAGDPDRGGDCLVWGRTSEAILDALAALTQLRITQVAADPEWIDRQRRRLAAQGRYGERVALRSGGIDDVELPVYLARLAIVDDPSSVALAGASSEQRLGRLKRILASVRPYGGSLWLRQDEPGHQFLSLHREALGMPELALRRQGEWSVLTRTAGPAGAANWTHEHADAANTRFSPDELVRAPLGLLWFGGPTHVGVLPRHGHGPQPQVIDGRLMIEGPDMLRAVDIYNGRLLWQRELPGLGRFFDNMAHQPGANATNTNYISTSDAIYVAYLDRCLRLDPATGQTLGEIALPRDSDQGDGGQWGYLNVSGDYLVGGASPLVVSTERNRLPQRGKNDNLSASKRLVVMDRHDGRVLWTADAVNHFRHNAICIGGGKLMAVDLLTQAEIDRLKRRGEEPSTSSRLVVFDLASGRELWSTSDAVFGTYLSYSAEHDVLVESGRPARDTLGDEPHEMRAFAAADGQPLWRKPYDGPAIIWQDTIFTGQRACDLLTGEPRRRIDPVSGRSVEWQWKRNYGCNTPMGARNLLTFRSGAAGYYDLLGDGGTGNFGGFRSGCTNNLIVAGGVLSAPDYTRECTCNYQNQCSLALVHMPEGEIWTEFVLDEAGPVERLALNLGAPGNRRAADGTLWLASHPRVTVEHDEPGYFTGHAALVGDGPLAFVAASGCRGVKRVTIDLASGEGPAAAAHYGLVLYFGPPEPGQAVAPMGIEVNGRPVVESSAAESQAAGAGSLVVRRFSAVEAAGELVITMAGTRTESGQAAAPALVGLELVRE